MNTGAFGENFPYSNFHDLNMDWIIKIAKDFLDQYTHIQEVIANGEQSLQELTEQGLSDLEEKANYLENLLQTWYNTHSEDIANQLADALQDLNAWYAEHQNYLNQTLITKEAEFLSYITEKADETIQSIPADYTTLFNEVQSIGDSCKESLMRQFCSQNEYDWKTGYWEQDASGNPVLNSSQSQYKSIILKNLPVGYYVINNYSAGQTYVKNLKTGVSTSFYTLGHTQSNTPLNFHLDTISDIYLTVNTNSVSISRCVVSNVWVRTNVLNPLPSNWQEGYWRDDLTITTDANYVVTTVLNLPAGIYEFNYYSMGQTYIKNRNDNTASSFYTLGYRTSNKKMTIEIPYNFDLYLTQRKDVIPYRENAVFEHEVFLSDKLDCRDYFENGNIFYVGVNRTIQKLVDGIILAEKFQNSILYVDNGNYNMYEELGGDSYFNTYDADPTAPEDYYEPNWGIFLKNGIHIICSEGCKIYFIYNGSNTDVNEHFSLFNGGIGGFTLENAEIETKNIRYSIHDDMGGYTNPYCTKYINCKISHDSSTAPVWNQAQAIGGGFGRHGRVVFESCIIKSTYWIAVSYHNASGLVNAELTSGVSSNLFMSSCWLSGALVTNAYGRSQDITEIYVSNCNVGTTLPDPQITGNYGVMNVVSNRWNNVVR